MKKMIGLGDNSTMDLEKSQGDMDQELSGDMLKKRARSQLRSMSINRSTSAAPKIVKPMDQVINQSLIIEI